MAENQVLSIDPGREKCGLAVVHREQGVIYKAIIATTELVATTARLAASYEVTTIVIGNSTTSKAAQAELQSLEINGQKINLATVDEYRSTDAARQRYWQDHPPKGLRRLIPTSLQVPPVPVDDYAAVILAERYFAKT